MLQSAIAQHARTGDTAGHRAWIAYLLHEYYDGMYSYQLEKKNSRIVFSGSRNAVLDYLRDTYQIGPKDS
jgi:tRNA 2-selenouridine synthase